MKKFNVVGLSKDTHFSMSVSLETVSAIANAAKKTSSVFALYHFVRADYVSFVAREQASGGQYDNTLTCYYKTDEAIMEMCGMAKDAFKKAWTVLQELGLVILLPFTANGKERKNIIVLDYALEDYKIILEECARRLQKLVSEKRRGNKATKRLDTIKEILKNRFDIEVPELVAVETHVVKEEEELPSQAISVVLQRMIEESIPENFNPFSY